MAVLVRLGGVDGRASQAGRGGWVDHFLSKFFT